jgi:multidrug efflux pump subunit AcrB
MVRHVSQDVIARPSRVCAALVGFGFVQQQFFPASTRLELLVDLKLPEGSSLGATDREVKKLEAVLAREPKLIANYVVYVGSGRRASTCRSISSCRRELRAVRRHDEHDPGARGAARRS